MPKRRLFARLLPTYAAVALIAALALGWFVSSRFEQASLRDERTRLAQLADFLDQQLGPEIEQDREAFARTCRHWQQAADVRIRLIGADGKVDFDSGRPADEVDSQLDRPELRQALGGTTADAIRSNPAQDERSMYVAWPLLRHDKPAGVIYLSASLAALDDGIGRLRMQIALVGLALVALSVPVAWWAARGIAEPLDALRQGVAALAEGKWSARVAVPEERELASLVESFNRMAESLERRMAVLTQNNKEQQAVLASMAEGVLAVDVQERVISVNPACGRLLGLDQAQAQGRRLQEAVRNADLTRFISRALVEPEPVEADVLLHGDRERVMQARGSALHDLEGKTIGAVVVLNDVTDFRRLEHIRRDFVANVSHELKTPITSIKGFVETLLDGAMANPVDAERFLRIMAKQADRLHAIIEDLLSLSKIEEREDADTIALETGTLRGVLESAVNTCQLIAGERQIPVALECDGQLTARINAMLLEQAVVNLLDNAIKYSEPGREVRIGASQANGEVAISVADRGAGIAAEHIPRIFERFYRVDRARSRKLGGTGLGLAIVKHIVQAHHGRVVVDSTLGVGSTFTIYLPAA